MAKNSFLARDVAQKIQAELLDPALWKASGSVKDPSRRVEARLEEELFTRLSALGNFKESRPIFVGSLARQEFCFQSDIDLLCTGPEDVVAGFSRSAQEQGIKVRLRHPEDLNDWTVGVEPFDVLALTQARAAFRDDDFAVLEQKNKIQKRKDHWSKLVFRAIREEKLSRRERYDSVANYLQPNLKYGPGGLRDVEQILSFIEFFKPELTRQFPESLELLLQHKNFLLKLRQLNHLMGAGDTLSAQTQLQMVELLGFKSGRDFTTQIQTAFGEASLLADGLTELSRLSQKQRLKNPLEGLKNWDDLFAKLGEKSPWVLNFHLRFQRQSLEGRTAELRPAEGRPAEGRGFSGAQFLKTMMAENRTEEFWLNLFRSGLLEIYLKEFSLIKGLVQHDHYHKFTVDAHLIQALRELSRFQKRPKRFGDLGILAKALEPKHWEILRYAALFHDLGKGREADHSTVGRDLVEKILGDLKVEKGVRTQVAWIVENHLILSTAAFRMNPSSSKTWKVLFDRGMLEERIPLLFVFTLIDIMATNPEAWTEWKARTMFDLYKNMTSSAAGEFGRFVEIAEREKIPAGLLERLDPYLIEQVLPKRLIEDVKRALKTKVDLRPLVMTDSKGSVWVRFHRKQDRPGLFFEFVRRLYLLGDHIQACVVMTDEKLGVYDWFCLRGRSTKAQVAKRLALPLSKKISETDGENGVRPEVFFENIDLVSQSGDEFIISFRGKNQKGLLLNAARGLFEENLSIVWVRAHTWGAQVDDTFAVVLNNKSKNEGIETVVERLRARFTGQTS